MRCAGAALVFQHCKACNPCYPHPCCCTHGLAFLACEGSYCLLLFAPVPTQVQAVQSHDCLDAADCICQQGIQSLAASTLEGTRQQLTLCTAVVAMHQHTITVHSQTTARSKSMELRQVRLFLFTPADHSTGLLDVQHGILATCVALEQIRNCCSAALLIFRYCRACDFTAVFVGKQYQFCRNRQVPLHAISPFTSRT